MKITAQVDLENFETEWNETFAEEIQNEIKEQVKMMVRKSIKDDPLVAKAVKAMKEQAINRMMEEINK